MFNRKSLSQVQKFSQGIWRSGNLDRFKTIHHPSGDLRQDLKEVKVITMFVDHFDQSLLQ